MAFAKFQDNRFGIDGEIAENHAILVNLTASIVIMSYILREIYLGYPNHSLHLFGKKHLYIAKPSVRIKLTFGQNIKSCNI